MTTTPPLPVAGFSRERLELDPAYGRIRRGSPVAPVRLPDGTGAWLVTGWEEARQVLSDPVFSRARAAGRSPGAPRREIFIADMDPPEHTRMRRHAARAFTHRRVQELRPRVEEAAGRLLDAMEHDGAPADLVERLALPLPVTVICELFGVPPGDRTRFQRWSEAFLTISAYSPAEVRDAHEALDAYLGDLIERRRADPGDDLLSALAHADDEDGEDGGLGPGELVGLGAGLLVAGYETTASQITNLTYTLLSLDGEWARLADRPELLSTAIEELLRFVPPGSDTGMPRVATVDVELGGVLVRSGDTVLVARPAANRDERVFPFPESLVLDRPDNPHLAFGHGIHHCLGAHLARLELQVSLGGLLGRFPRLRLAAPESALQWKAGSSVRGLYQLPVTWTDTRR
ncbi:cytochrome P450 [Spirillospora sp. NPDC047279]|uniref:cytochrome P450 n=1 Tax=Spirillospora sp. NPDC047279 TaxID=3155478 RepID=UPI0033E79F8E